MGQKADQGRCKWICSATKSSLSYPLNKYTAGSNSVPGTVLVSSIAKTNRHHLVKISLDLN